MLCVSVWVALAPAIAAQYALAMIGLIALSRRDMSGAAYVVWNIVILLVFFAGSIAFLVYNRVRPRPKADDTSNGEQTDGEENR